MNSPTPLATATNSASASKAALRGLVAMGFLGFTAGGGVPDNGMEEINAHPGVYAAAVINATWAQLEPSPGTFDDSAIASALAAIGAYNAKYPGTPVVGKLRVYAGPNVPAWIFGTAGGPIAISGPQGSERISAFWTSAYDAAWQGLQAHLASVYDASPAIGEVAVSSCSSLSAEPFVIALDAPSLAAMRQFGFSDAMLMACLNHATADYGAWKMTPLDFTFNMYRLSDGPSLVSDPAFTTSVMQSFRSALGGRGVIANHGLQPPTAGATEPPVYTEIAALGPPVEFQSVSPIVDWPATVSVGVSYHATEIEIWPTIAAGGLANITQAQLVEFAAQLP